MGTQNIPQSQKELVQSLKAEGVIKSDVVYEIMSSIDRKHFMKEKFYEDVPLYGCECPCSNPRFHALVLELLVDKLKVGGRVLMMQQDSYLASCFAKALGSECFIFVQHLKKNIWINGKCKGYYPELVARFVDIRDNSVGSQESESDIHDFHPYDIIYLGSYILRRNGIFPEIINHLAPGGRIISLRYCYNRNLIIEIHKSYDGQIERNILELDEKSRKIGTNRNQGPADDSEKKILQRKEIDDLKVRITHISSLLESLSCDINRISEQNDD